MPRSLGVKLAQVPAVRRAPRREDVVFTFSTSVRAYHGRSPGSVFGIRPPHCSRHTQTGLSPEGWELGGTGHWKARAWDGHKDD